MAAAPSHTPFEILRQQRHAAWLADLTTRLEQLVASLTSADRGPLEILLFGSRARGDWDGLSDTDLLVVAAEKQQASLWVDRLLDAGVAQDVVAFDQTSWQALSSSPSPYWRSVKSQAIPLLHRGP
jgi:predicted nucleotidyltransferase